MIRRRSLRGRVSALGAMVVASWLLVLTVVFNVVLAARLRIDLDSTLRARAAAAAATLARDRAGNVVVRETRGDQAIDSDMWAYASGTAIERPKAVDALQHAADAFAGTATMPGYKAGPHSVRMYALPVRQGSLNATIIAAASVRPALRTQDEAMVGSVIVAMLALAGAYAALRLAAERALRPVTAMTRQAGEWSASALTERFDPDQRFVELESLAGTLNGVLNRQAATVRHERQLMTELSHELRTPLTRILAELDLLQGLESSADPYRTGQLAIRAAAEGMVRIVETLLPTDSAAGVDAPGRCEMQAVVTAVMSHRKPGATISVSVPDGLVASIQSAVAERIVSPILDNAERHARGSVTIEAWRGTDEVVVSISDDGPGVPEDLGTRAFEPGAQGSCRGGAGLGLPLARRLARAAAGDVTHVGGSTFEVRLPPA